MNIFSHFQHLDLTTDQTKALIEIDSFLKNDNNVFILKGYAGSGKTTLLKGVVSHLEASGREFSLLAPTGRAAKVIQQKTGKKAFTIHKGIYSFKDLEEVKLESEDEGESFIYYYKLANNTAVRNRVFIIDEASMVSDVYSKGEFFRFGSGFLLKDLVEYSRVNSDAMNAKIIFVGDPAQLPPVGMAFSPALDEGYLQKQYALRTSSNEIKEVKRQGGESGILKAAAKIRKSLTSGYFNDFDLRSNGLDIHNPAYEDFLQIYNAAGNRKIIISYKNKTALDLNQLIRDDKFGSRLPIQAGDHIIMGGNNYRLDLMNGEFGVVVSSSPSTVTRQIPLNLKGGKKELVSLNWRWVELLVPCEEKGQRVVAGYMLENFLEGDNHLKPVEQQALYVDFKQRHPGLKARTPEFVLAVSSDEFFNPVLLKYGYAVTCHKAQGGEWDTVFTFWDRSGSGNTDFRKDVQNQHSKTNPDFYRWAYTAVTRASGNLFCINPPYFNSFSNLSFISSPVQDAFAALTGTASVQEEICVDDETEAEMGRYQLADQPLPLQDHFVRIRAMIRKRYIEIRNWKLQGYEVWYTFGREAEQATFRFWIKGNNEFNGKSAVIPAQTTSAALAEELQKMLNSPLQATVVRNTPAGIVSKIEYDWELEESKPFLKVLFDSLGAAITENNVRIEDVEHLEYKERFTFVRGGEKAVIDFEYNKDGFFGRVMPLGKRCNSNLLLEDLKNITNRLAEKEHVI